MTRPKKWPALMGGGLPGEETISVPSQVFVITSRHPVRIRKVSV
jgi:hypothetical protein